MIAHVYPAWWREWRVVEVRATLPVTYPGRSAMQNVMPGSLGVVRAVDESTWHVYFTHGRYADTSSFAAVVRNLRSAALEQAVDVLLMAYRTAPILTMREFASAIAVNADDGADMVKALEHSGRDPVLRVAYAMIAESRVLNGDVTPPALREAAGKAVQSW